MADLTHYRLPLISLSFSRSPAPIQAHDGSQRIEIAQRGSMRKAAINQPLGFTEP